MLQNIHDILYTEVYISEASVFMRHGWRSCEAYDILYTEVYISEASGLMRHGWRSCEAYDILNWKD